MTRVALVSGPYQARSLIASAQRSVNVFPESNQDDPQAPVPVTQYPTPGLNLFSASTTNRVVRQIYRSTAGLLYAVIGPNVYYIDNGGTQTKIGTIADLLTTVYFIDNGLVIVLVDGTSSGYAIDMTPATLNTFGQINDPSFYGADFAVYFDSFFVFNRPNTNQFYISLSFATYSMLTDATGAATGVISAPGSGYTAGTYNNVALTGGSGSGATANITVGSGIATGTITIAGSGYVPGTYTLVPLTGGAGSGATATITINSSGAVSAVVISQPGANYAVGNILSAGNGQLGGSGSGFTYTLNTVSSASVTNVTLVKFGTGYVVGDVLSAAGIGAGTGFTYTILTLNLAFDPLDIAAKAGGADNIVGISNSQPYLMLVGVLSSEPWYNTGAADFTFGRVPGTFIAHGCNAKYSIASQDVFAFWLSQDYQGFSVILRAKGSQAERISTHAIEADISTYANPNDGIGFCYQQQGHSFYILTFPTDQKTWVFELATGQWHELAWTDGNGNLLRHRANCATFAYGRNLVGDWQNGRIYTLDPEALTDDGAPIVRIRTFPHMIDDGNRVVYNKFIVDIQTGTIPDGTNPQLSLRWSDDRGVSYGNPVLQTFGRTGDYLAQISYNRLGMARDRVFEVSWSAPVKTALNGAFVEIKSSRS